MKGKLRAGILFAAIPWLMVAGSVQAGVLFNQIGPRCVESEGASAYQIIDGGTVAESAFSADNFRVIGQWDIDSVLVQGQSDVPLTGGTYMATVEIYNDFFGLPNEVAPPVCSYTDVEAQVIDDRRFQVDLSPVCRIEQIAGQYWVSVSLDSDIAVGESRFSIDQNPNALDPVPWAFRSPDVGSCSSWKPASECGVDVIAENLCVQLKGGGSVQQLRLVPDQVAVLGQPYFLDVASYFFDPDGDALTFIFFGLSGTGLSGDASSGVISGVPNQVGDITVTVTAQGDPLPAIVDTFVISVADEAVPSYDYQRLYPLITRPWHFNNVSGDLDISTRGSQFLVGNPDFFRIDRMTLDGLPITGQALKGEAGGNVKPFRLAVDREGFSTLITYLEDGVSIDPVPVRLDSTGARIASFNGVSGTPLDVAVTDEGCPGGDGCVFVISSSELHRFDKSGNLLGRYPLGITNANAIHARDDGLLVISSSVQVHLYDEPDAPDFDGAPVKRSTVITVSNQGATTDPLGNIIVAVTNTGLRPYTQAGAAGALLPPPPGLLGPFAPLRVVSNERGDGYVYSTEFRIDRFKFTGDSSAGGTILYGGRFSNAGTGNGELIDPTDVKIDDAGNAYVIDSRKQTLQRFDADGTARWSRDISDGLAPDQHKTLQVFLTQVANVSVAGVFDQQVEARPRFVISLFQADDGTPIGPAVALDGSFTDGFGDVSDVHADRFGVIYPIGENQFGAVEADGTDATTINESSDPVCPITRTVKSDLGASGLLYFLDSESGLLSTYTTDGVCQTDQRITVDGSNFSDVTSFAVAPDGSFAVGQRDPTSNAPSILKFSPDGTQIGSQGRNGFFPDSYVNPISLTFTDSDDLFVLDRTLRRVQRLDSTVTLGRDVLAVLVSAGGPYAGNDLWDETQANLNFAYTTLRYQGLDRDRIQFLSPDLDLDIDGDGLANDVDADVSLANVGDALTNWATGAEEVIFYLADHGDTDQVRLTPTELMSATDLAGFVDTLQASSSTRFYGIYEACESGSFLDDLGNSAAVTSPGDRIFITSASEGQDANFANGGFLSFSNQFWTWILLGLDLEQAFERARDSIGAAFQDQDALVDYDNDGLSMADESDSLTGIILGAGTDYASDAPQIASVTPEQVVSGNSAVIEAFGVTDPDGIARVWAVIQVPDLDTGQSSNPVLEFPTVDLLPVSQGSSTYVATYDSFDSEGQYTIQVFAQDTEGNTFFPNPLAPTNQTRFTVGDVQARRALIVTGGDSADASFADHEINAQLAYASLRTQGYLDGSVEDIRFLSDSGAPNVDAPATAANIQNALTSWAASNTRDLVVYLVGDYDLTGFRVDATDRLTPAGLDTQLDALQASLPGTVVVVIESDQSGTFIPQLQPPADKIRYLVSSASPSQNSSLFNGGGFSFSQFFWSSVVNGASLRDAFQTGAQGMDFASNSQTPQIEDNGNGISNDGSDGLNAAGYFLGPGLVQAGNGPLIGGNPLDQSITGSQATIDVTDVTSTGTIDRVFAIVTSPDPLIASASFDLADQGGNRYAASNSGFGPSAGDYPVSIYAADAAGNLSFQTSLTITRSDGRDAYEVDNAPPQANVLSLGAQPQNHNFHSAADEDWVYFPASAAVGTFEFALTGTTQQFQLELYVAQSGCSQLMLSCMTRIENRTAPVPGDYMLAWSNTRPDETIYVRVSAANSATAPYSLQLTSTSLPLTGILRGSVIDSSNSQPIAGAFISTTGNVDTFSNIVGQYQLVENPGSYSATVSAAGYQPSANEPFTVVESATTWLNVALTPEGTATASTGGATAITRSSAILDGSIDPASFDVSMIRFAYGETPGALDLTATATPDTVLSTDGVTAVSTALSGLGCNTTYYYQLLGNSSQPAALSGAEENFVTAACPATATTGSASAIDRTTATLAGVIDPSSFDVTDIRLAYGLTSGALTHTVTATPATVVSSDGATAVSGDVSGLACATTYYFQLLGDSSEPALAMGSESSFTTSDCVAPSANTGAASGIGQGGATLNATVNPNASGNSTVIFEYGLTAGYGMTLPAAESPVSGSGALPVSAALSGLSCNTLYNFRVSASNVQGTADGSNATFTTAACNTALITTETPTAVSQTSATLQGTVDPNGSNTSSIQFRYGLTPGSMNTVTAATPNGLSSGDGLTSVSADISGLSCGNTYFTQAEATNAGGTAAGPVVAFDTASCSLSLLLVDDDDNAPDVRADFAAALDATGTGYTVWDTGAGDAEPLTADLQAYDAVIWFTGNASGSVTGPSSSSEVALSEFLDAGACVVVSSQDYFSVRGLTSLMQGYLGIDMAQSDTGQTTAAGNTPEFAGLPPAGSYSLQFGGGISNRSDSLTPVAMAEAAFQGDVGTIAVQNQDIVFNTLYLGFPFSSLPGPIERSQVMGAILNYCQSVDRIFADSFE